MDLAPLDRAEVAQQLAALGTFDLRASQEIFLRSEGNPFYVEELAAAWTTGHPTVPEVVRDAAEVRVALLPSSDRDVVRLLAALGRPATFDLIQILSGHPPAELLAILHRAVEAGLFMVDPPTVTYRFRHALLAEAVTADLLPGGGPNCTETLHGLSQQTPLCRPDPERLATTRPQPVSSTQH